MNIITMMTLAVWPSFINKLILKNLKVKVVANLRKNITCRGVII